MLGDSEAPTISVTLALYSVNANTAVATSDVTSRAFISGAAIQTSGALNVGAEGNAVANANVTTTSSVGYVAVGITTTFAYANGTFKAYIDSADGADIEAGSIDVTNKYAANAQAVTMQPNGGVGFTVALGAFDSNIATAIVGTIAKAYIDGDGSVSASGKINVWVKGLAHAIASNEKPLFKLTAVSIAANILTATLAAGQSAFIRGAAVTAESLTIDASFNDERLIGYQLGDAGIFITTLQNHGRWLVLSTSAA